MEIVIQQNTQEYSQENPKKWYSLAHFFLPLFSCTKLEKGQEVHCMALAE
jgi:hypothetical protein